MRKSKFIVFGLAALALIITLGMFTSVLNNYKEQNKKTVISLQNVLSQGKSKATIKDYLNITKTYEEMEETAFCCELPNQQVYKTKITPVLISPNFLDCSNISFKGEGITEVMENSREKTAVISESFADKHFYGSTAIGKTFIMDDTRYRVTGIYDDKNTNLNNLFKDGKERIYINYTGIEEYKIQNLTSILCNTDSKAARMFPKLGFKNFARVDFREKNMAVNNFTVILCFVLTVIISVYLIKIWTFSFSSTIDFLKKKSEKQYILGLIRKNLPSLLLRLIILLGIPAGIFLLFVLCFRNFHLVESYIDKDNLFSISHMIEQLGITLQRENTTLFAGNSFPMNLYNGTLIILAGLTPVIVVLFFFTLYSGISAVREIKTGYSVIMGIFLFITVISLIISLTSGYSYSFFEIIALFTGVFLLWGTNSIVRNLKK